MSWKIEYIFLIVLSTIVDYYASVKMSSTKEKNKRKKYLYLSLFTNLGLLFFFKYFNFFSESVEIVLNSLGYQYLVPHLNIILPVGISFYTFQTMSYSIDVFNEKTKIEKHFGIFALFVSFFPQLVAGPIERSERLLPQFRVKHQWDYNRVTSGLKLMAWGFFKKVVIADRLSMFVNEVFNHPTGYEGLDIWVATIFFAFQIYCDFSGYSDIAIGAAQVMGFELMKNFNRPYFSKSVGEFWKRWHISLSTWFRDYTYIPLGGNRTVKWRWYYNLFITFLISGLWHGANWTFIIWGALHGIYMIIGSLTSKYRLSLSRKSGLLTLPLLNKFTRIVTTFGLVCLAWIFFRANTIADAFILLKRMFMINLENLEISIMNKSKYDFFLALLFIPVMESIHYFQRNKQLRKYLETKPTVFRWLVYIIAVILILNFGVFDESEFIYFQF